MDPRNALLLEIDAFIARRAMAESTFGRVAVNDGKFVSRLRSGGNITFATAAKVRAFIAAQSESNVTGEASNGVSPHAPVSVEPSAP